MNSELQNSITLFFYWGTVGMGMLVVSGFYSFLVNELDRILWALFGINVHILVKICLIPLSIYLATYSVNWASMSANKRN